MPCHSFVTVYCTIIHTLLDFDLNVQISHHKVSMPLSREVYERLRGILDQPFGTCLNLKEINRQFPECVRLSDAK